MLFTSKCGGGTPATRIVEVAALGATGHGSITKLRAVIRQGSRISADNSDGLATGITYCGWNN